MIRSPSDDSHSERVSVARGLRTPPHRQGERSEAIEQLEQVITRDVARRGLAHTPHDNLVTRCRGNLERAARHLAFEGSSVAIATGFYVASGSRDTVETDGPCGAIALGWLLAALDYDVTIVTDPLGAPVVSAGLSVAGTAGLPVQLAVFPFDGDESTAPARCSNDPDMSLASRAFTEGFFHSGAGRRLTHLIAVERAGPSHSVALNSTWSPEQIQSFQRLCPPEHQNQVHNFQGRVITAYTGKIHLLFDFIRDHGLPIRSIGIGDGGNEIGIGSIPWQVVHQNITGGLGARIACRVATEWTVACGVSNWGAYALAAAVAWLRRQPAILLDWTDARERAVLQALVDKGAVDGISGTRELSVDNLPLEQHLAVWSEIRDAVRRGSSL
jgi:hypothetical protein